MKRIVAVGMMLVCTAVTSLFAVAAQAQTVAQAPGASASSSDAEVLARARALIGVMRERLGDTQAAIKRGELEAYFDFAALTDAPIAAHKKAFSVKQRAHLQKIFAQLVRQLAYASGAQFKDGNSKLIEPLRRDASQHVLSDIAISHPDDDVDSQVTFVWAQQRQGWRVIDVSLDGASIVKDYENQFAKIIAKDGGEGLLKKMQARLNEAESKTRRDAKKPQQP